VKKPVRRLFAVDDSNNCYHPTPRAFCGLPQPAAPPQTGREHLVCGRPTTVISTGTRDIYWAQSNLQLSGVYARIAFEKERPAVCWFDSSGRQRAQARLIPLFLRVKKRWLAQSNNTLTTDSRRGNLPAPNHTKTTRSGDGKEHCGKDRRRSLCSH
jgi:hypothetical protein